MLSLSSGAWAAPRQTLHGHVPAITMKLARMGRLPSSQHLSLSISLPLRNQAALTVLLRQQNDPASPNYRHYLSSTQFTEKFGPSKQDYQAVIAFAQSHGLAVTGVHPNRMILDVEGPVANVETAFHVAMWSYRHPTDARSFYSPDVDPSIDLSVPVLSVDGLDNYALPHPRLKLGSPATQAAAGPPTAKRGTARSHVASSFGSAPNGGYMGNDFRTAYAPGVSLTGAGQSVGLVQFDGYTTSDITYYESLTGRTNVTLINVLLDGFSGAPSYTGGKVEVSLDIEMAISMAPGLSNIIVYEGGPTGSWHDVLNRMATDNLAKQLSCSWYIPSGPADPTADQIFQQMAAQGQSFFSASGDYDAFTGLIPFPGDTPYVTEVGGTLLTTASAGGAYSSETVWNRNNGIGSGGGISTQYTIPSWQLGISMTANLGSTTMRNVPDVALTAEDVYVRADGIDEAVGGTSCAAPLWAGFTALVNQQAVANTGTTVGFINPVVYAIGAGANYASDFHDTVVGNNFSPTSPANFPGVSGYDLATGWGSPTGSSLIDALAGPVTPVITTTGSLPFGVAGAAYHQALTVVGGSPAYTWSIISGSLPSNISLSSSGVISGTTLAVGTFAFTVQVADSKGNVASAPLGLTIYAQGSPTVESPATLVSGIVGNTYSFSLAANGGAAPYSWSLVAGTLPAGLGLSSAGTITGVPTVAGTSNFTVQVTDQNGLFSPANLSLTILPAAPVITSALTASAQTGTAFTYQITATNNPTGFSVSNLPPGLTLSASSASGLISGLPTVAGTFYVTLGASNASGTGTATLVLTVNASPPVIGAPLKTIASFNETNGAYPSSQLIKGTDGNFYGTTAGGGSAYDGTVFVMTPAGIITILHTFTGTDGSFPEALTLGADGNFYGTTSGGGANSDGTIFEITSSGSFTTLFNFSGSDGQYPYAKLLQAADGSFYGTTLFGGSLNYGTIFNFVPSTGSLTKLFEF